MKSDSCNPMTVAPFPTDCTSLVNILDFNETSMMIKNTKSLYTNESRKQKLDKPKLLTKMDLRINLWNILFFGYDK
jgi:hypothetical protein